MQQLKRILKIVLKPFCMVVSVLFAAVAGAIVGIFTSNTHKAGGVTGGFVMKLCNRLLTSLD